MTALMVKGIRKQKSIKLELADVANVEQVQSQLDDRVEFNVKGVKNWLSMFRDFFAVGGDFV